jgi:hypothetical protein
MNIIRLFKLLMVSFVLSVLVACSGGSGGGTTDSLNTSTTTDTGTGRVALLLTDAPSDIFEEINITVVKAELLSDDGGKVTLFKGKRTFNLLDLTDVEIFAIRDGVPTGTYNKIRLTLIDNGIELVDYNDSNNPADYDVYYPKLPGNNKLDLNPRGDFTVVAGGTLAIQIDIDANKSIHIVKKGKKDEYNFRPVVFIDIVTDAFIERFVKLHGDITAINTVDLSFKLCNTKIPVQIDDDQIKTGSSGCVRVETDKITAIFDIDGKPAAFSDLVEGEPATVFGHLLRDTDYDHDSDKHGDRDDDREMDDLVLKAALIELGPESAFQKLNGKATSTVNIDDQFTMDVAPGQGLTTPLILTVQIQKGTLLIDRKGNPVKITEIYKGKLVSARGVLDVNRDLLFASVILVDTDSSEQLTGKIAINPDKVCGFTITDDVVGDRSVATDSSTKAFLVVDGSSSPISVSELKVGQPADVYGISSFNGCFDAHTIIAY